MKISEIIKLEEGKTLEFKRDLSSPKNILKTVVAFANTAGGKIIVGLEDKTRKVIGIENPLDEEERFCNLVADSISPCLVPNIELTTVEGKTLLIIEVFLSNSRPHYLSAPGPEAGTLVRLGSTNRQADRELITEIGRFVQGVSFDETPMVNLTVDDLDLESARRIFNGLRELTLTELHTLKLLTTCQGESVPTKGGMLLFGKNRTFHFSDCWVQCGRFIGKDKARIFDHTEFEEPLPQMVDSIMFFLKKHAMRSADFSEVRRKDVWDIPLEPLREAVINALVHADYSQRGGPIRVAFFDDRIEIESPGILPSGITVEDMKDGVSKIRNPVIARIFRELKLIEQWGSGVPRMYRETVAEGFPEPKVIELGLKTRFIFPLAKSLKVREGEGAQSNLDLETLSTPGAQSGAQSKILESLIEKPMSASEIALVLGVKSKTGSLKRTIKQLLENGLIEYTIPEKPNSRLQKYRLVNKKIH